MTRAPFHRLVDAGARLDQALLRTPGPVRAAVYAVTVLAMAAVSLPNVPRAWVDLAGLPLVGRIQQPETYGTDTIADMYVARVVLNDPFDMYTKAKVEQTPLEARTWTRQASAPYPPAVLLAEAALAAAGGWIGIGFYGAILAVAVLFLAASAAWFWTTRWYLFPVLYLNFEYVSERFVYVQDASYLVMLAVLMGAIRLARARNPSGQVLVAVAIAMKLSPLFYMTQVARMPRTVAAVFLAVLFAGLVLPYFIWDHYLYIFQYGAELKGDWDNAAAALLLVVPFALTLWYVETRLDFDVEDRIGWGLVPFALLLALKMNAARHLLIVLLVPDRRGFRNLAAAAGLAVPAVLPVPFNASLAVATTLLVGALVYYLSEVGWDRVGDDLRHPGRTIREMVGSRPSA